MKTRVKALLSLWAVALSPAAWAASPPPAPASADTQTSVSLKNEDLPASDLLYSEGGAPARVLSPIEAWTLKQNNHVDLSLLEPDSTTDEWPGKPTQTDSSLDQALSLGANVDTASFVNFLGTITSSSGRIRFNVQTRAEDGPVRTMTLLLARNAHTFLLRKELLRRLGYRVPAMRFIPKARIKFPDAATRDFFLTTQIPNATFATAARWQVPAPAGANPEDPLVVTLQDLLLMEATPPYYNLALGPPIEFTPNTTDIRPEGPRILRALAVIYALADLPESMNQLDWYSGHTANGSVILDTPDIANFACSLDDALWVMRRIAGLTRADFAAVTAGSYLPDPIAQVLTEKLIARRDSLVSIFSVPSPRIDFNSGITIAPAVKKGKVLQQDWPGYASRFAFGDPQSPLQGLQWFALSVGESNALDNLVSMANEALPALTTQAAILQHQDGLLARAITEFLNTGKVTPVPFGLWVAPIAGGGFHVSRNAVIGDYLGTNNLVQLADEFGLSAQAGVMVGVDGLPGFAGVQGTFQAAVNWNLVHLKPLTRMKDLITEPIQNTLVPWVFLRAADALHRVSEVEQHAGTESPDQLKKELAQDLDDLKKSLGVGESLILTLSLSGTEGISGGIQGPTVFSPEAIGQVGLNQLVVSRMQFYRKDANTIQIFKDGGDLLGLNVAFDVGVGGLPEFKLLSLSASGARGKAHSDIFQVNVNPDPDQNPGVYSAAAAITHALRTGSTDLLTAASPPAKLSVKFRDSDSRIQLLHYMRRTLKENSLVHIELPDGSKGDYVDLSQGKQTGSHYQGLATEIASYFLARLTQNGGFGVDTSASPNPGTSFLGHSETRQLEYQARVAPEVSDPYVKVLYRWQGWDMSAKDIIKLTGDLSARYGLALYPEGFLGDAQSVKLYQISLGLSFYGKAIARIMGMSEADEAAFAARYTAQHHCDAYYAFQWDGLSEADMNTCYSLADFRDALADHRDNLKNPDKMKKDPRRDPAAMLKAIDALEKFVEFPELVRMAGGPDQIFMRSLITGFRTGSETLSDPIVSNSMGQVDPVNPGGVLSTAQGILGIGDGEFDFQWLREVL
jgi:hypothetical protein